VQTNLNHDDALNILILSCGTRNKIVQYFRRELDGRGMVIAADCSELAPALYDAHRYFIVPHVNSHNYIETILASRVSSRLLRNLHASTYGTRSNPNFSKISIFSLSSASSIFQTLGVKTS
jgi:hypothetical protein